MQSHIWAHATCLGETEVNITDWGWKIEERVSSPVWMSKIYRHIQSNLKDANAIRIADKISVFFRKSGLVCTVQMQIPYPLE